MTAPTPAYLTELAGRVRTGSGISNRLDIEIELALFDPKVGSFVSVQPNASRTKLVYRRADGTDVTAHAHDWTMRREHSATQLRLRAVELMKELAPAPANPAALDAAIANLEAFERDGTILSEVENEVAFTENVALCLHELKRLRAVDPAPRPVIVGAGSPSTPLLSAPLEVCMSAPTFADLCEEVRRTRREHLRAVDAQEVAEEALKAAKASVSKTLDAVDDAQGALERFIDAETEAA